MEEQPKSRPWGRKVLAYAESREKFGVARILTVGEKGTLGQESLMVSCVGRQAKVFGYGPVGNGGGCYRGFKAWAWCDGTTVSEQSPVPSVEVGLGGQAWSSLFERMGSTEALDGNSQSVVIPYSFLHSYTHLILCLALTLLALWAGGNNLNCCGFLMYKMSMTISNNIRKFHDN